MLVGPGRRIRGAPTHNTAPGWGGRRGTSASPAVSEAFEANGGRLGYRATWAELRRRGTRVSEKVVRRVMRSLGLRVVRSRSDRPWSSYDPAVRVAAPTSAGPRRDFSAGRPNLKWVTDVTEFRVPAGKLPTSRRSSTSTTWRPSRGRSRAPTTSSPSRRWPAPWPRWPRARGRSCTTTAGPTTAGRLAGDRAPRRAWCAPPRGRAAAGTTPPARGSSGA